MTRDELIADALRRADAVDLRLTTSLARIIRDFQKREAMLVEALGFYSDVSDYKAPLTGGMGKLYFDCGDKAKATLARIKSGEWMEDV